MAQDHEQRSVSYGELVELEQMFNEQVAAAGFKFSDEDERDAALFDFTQQYIDGDDNPKFNPPR